MTHIGVPYTVERCVRAVKKHKFRKRAFAQSPYVPRIPPLPEDPVTAPVTGRPVKPIYTITTSASCRTDQTLGVSMEKDSEQNVVNSIQADEETKSTHRDADGSGGDVSDTRTQSLERSEVRGELAFPPFLFLSKRLHRMLCTITSAPHAAASQKWRIHAKQQKNTSTAKGLDYVPRSTPLGIGRALGVRDAHGESVRPRPVTT